MLGLLIGDACGVPYEFHGPDQIPAFEKIDMQPPAGFRRSFAHVPVGTWSDDGAQALCLLDSLLQCAKLDLADFGNRLLDWQDKGFMAVDGIVFDIGIQTRAALQRLKAGADPDNSGPDGERENGNGSLMRCLPLALVHRGSDAELVRDAHLQSLVTHGHPRSQVACALYLLWARFELQTDPAPWARAIAVLRTLYPHNTAFREELEAHFTSDPPPAVHGTGYVVDSLHSARAACQHSTFEDVIRAAIQLGNDTDTTAAIAGGIAGIRHGSNGIPRHWRSQLRGLDLLDPLLNRLSQYTVAGLSR